MARIRRTPHGAQDSGVRAAAADVAVQGTGDRHVGGLGIAFEQGCGREHHARGAVPALKGALCEECLLDRVQRTVRGQALDRDQRPARNGIERRDARADRDPVGQDRACATLPLAAGRLGAGEAEFVAQDEQQRPRRVAGDCAWFSV
jgi:hypothetical protein